MKITPAKSLFILALLLSAAPLRAETLTGFVRNINYGSHSFGLDVPPIVRVYVTGGTRFEHPEGKEGFQAVVDGDKVVVEGRAGGPGVFTATKVKVLGGLAPVKDLAAGEVAIFPNQSFILGVNQTAVLKDGEQIMLKILGVEFINTLCKGGYDCGGEGDVGMRMKVSQGGKNEEIILISKNHRRPTSPVQAQIFNYEIQLMEAGEDVVSLVVRRL